MPRTVWHGHGAPRRAVAPAAPANGARRASRRSTTAHRRARIRRRDAAPKAGRADDRANRAGKYFRARHAIVEPPGGQRDEQVPPGTLEIERELVSAVGDKDIAASQGKRLAATADASLAVEVHAGAIQVIARACDVRACVHRSHAQTRDLRDADVADYSRVYLPTQGPLAGGAPSSHGQIAAVDDQLGA